MESDNNISASREEQTVTDEDANVPDSDEHKTVTEEVAQEDKLAINHRKHTNSDTTRDITRDLNNLQLTTVCTVAGCQIKEKEFMLNAQNADDQLIIVVLAYQLTKCTCLRAGVIGFIYAKYV